MLHIRRVMCGGGSDVPFGVLIALLFTAPLGITGKSDRKNFDWIKYEKYDNQIRNNI